MTRLVLIRHAEPDDAVRGRSYGRLDVPLSSAGREQARAIAATLRDLVLDAVYTSPLRRALETAEPLAAERNLEPVVHEGLRELDFGEIEGMSFAAVEEARPELFRAWMTDPTGTRFPGGEAFAELRERVLGAAGEIRARHASAAIVAHGGVTRAILADALAMPAKAMFRLDQPYGAVSVVDWIEEVPVVRSLNAALESGPWRPRSS